MCFGKTITANMQVAIKKKHDESPYGTEQHLYSEASLLKRLTEVRPPARPPARPLARLTPPRSPATSAPSRS